MTKQDIVKQLQQDPKLAEKYSEKYLKALVEEQLFLRDYKKTFSDELNEESNEEEDEIELEPEEIPIEEPDSPQEEPEEEQPEKEEPIQLPEPEARPETEEEPELEPTKLLSPPQPKPTSPEDVITSKKPEGDGYIRISPQQARELLSYKGKIFTAVFTKRSDGTLRALNGMTGVRKYTSGGELPYSPKEKELIPVYDLKIGPGPKGYRTIPVEGLKALKINGKKYKIDQSLQEIKVEKPNSFPLITKKQTPTYQNPIFNIDFKWGSEKGFNFNHGGEKYCLILKNKLQYPEKWNEISIIFSNYIRDINEVSLLLDLKKYPNFKDLTQNLQENMKKDALKQIVKEVIQEIRGTQPQRVSPDREVIEKPETDTPERKPKRRTLSPPTESPETRPKAEGVIKENEEELANKMASRFQKLKK